MLSAVVVSFVKPDLVVVSRPVVLVVCLAVLEVTYSVGVTLGAAVVDDW